MCVSRNNGSGQLAAPVCYAMSAGSRPKFIAIADLNGDGKGDVVVHSDNVNGGGNTSFNVFLNKGDGTFADHVSYLAQPTSNALRLGDVNGDGKTDLAAFASFNNALLLVLKNKGDGTFEETPEQYPIGSQSNSADELLVTGDFAGNGPVGFAAIDRIKTSVSVVAGSCRP